MRTIVEVVDVENEEIIKADDFFSQNDSEIFKVRNSLEKAFQQNKKYLVCPYCRQPVKIKGRCDGQVIMHFAHVSDNTDCVIKTKSKYTEDEILRIKYNGQKESERHYYLKNLIAEKLSKDSRFSEINVEKRFKGFCKEWRKPDVSAVFNGKKIAFELQLSTTFLSVVVERNTFYQNNSAYLIWIFDNKIKNVEDMRFMEKDIFYPNHHNAFFISEKADDLVNFKLTCGYEKPFISNNSVDKEWVMCDIDFSELTFSDDFKVFFFNYEKEIENIKSIQQKERINIFEEKWVGIERCGDKRELLEEYMSTFTCDLAYCYEFEGLLNCLYSLKYNKVVGYNFTKVIQVLHQYFHNETHRKNHFGEYVFQAIKAYGVREQILKEDREGKFVNKARKYKKEQYQLSHRYDVILRALFPEIFQTTSL